MSVLAALRNSGITAVPYLDANKKFKNQVEFADKIKARFSLIVGENERKNNVLSVKDMLSGTQQTLDIKSTIELLKTV